MNTLLVTLLLFAVSFAQPDGTPRLSGLGFITADCNNLRLGEEAPLPNYWVDEINNYVYPNLRLLGAQRDLPNSHRRAFNYPTIGCVDATFNVLPNLPAAYAKGLFSTAQQYRAFVRFSGFDQELQNNTDNKGMAIKVLGVTGTKLLPGFTDDTAVDFLLNAYPTLAQNNETVLAASVFARTQLSGGGDRGRAGLSTFYPLVVSRDAAERLNNTVVSSLLAPYYSVSAYRLGIDALPSPAAKYRVFPCDGAAPTGFVQSNLAVDHLTQDMTTRIATREYCFVFQVQLQTNVCNQPINDLSVEWLQTDSPFVTVATLNITVQPVQTDVNLTCRHAAFNPWRTTAEHRPLGSANRARLFAYMNSQNQRLSLNLAVEPFTQKPHLGWQFWAPTETGINNNFQTPVIKTYQFNPLAGNFHMPVVPLTPCPPRLCFN